jgi:virginiamycin A acetyltransferase
MRLFFLVFPGRRLQTFQGHSQLLAILPGATGNMLRAAFYRRALTECASDCCISFGTTFATWEVTIGPGVYIGPLCNIGDADIERDVLIGTGVMITSGRRQHFFKRLDVPIRLQGGANTRVRIGRDSWLGNGAIVTSSIGSQCVISAGAVVFDDVHDRSIMQGNPAVCLSIREHRE